MKQILFILLAIFLVGCQETELDIQEVSEETPPQANLELTTDKDLYHSNEMMNINVNIATDMQADNVSVRVYGIYASRNRLDMSKNLDLNIGSNDAVFEFKTPSCNTCSGIRAGTYEINAEISKDGEVIGKTSKEIEIRQ
ncbi:hypothetical protein KY345_00710 [Candidatus Woesearchaeota archaeon]|nr:hypothetical protein [Candidatus Woesearchaeota archaeon]